ncbi:MAG: hypothetical protein H0U69_03495 [Trueperaceae bacterium]|nr:hypothetical protein [Trueperaceae bacterium]
MMKIVARRRTIEIENLHRVFQHATHSSSSYSFSCHPNGDVDFNALAPIAAQNARELLAGRDADYRDVGVRISAERQVDPAIGQCECGQRTSLWTNDNECGCGRWYNASGQELLAPDARDRDAERAGY